MPMTGLERIDIAVKLGEPDRVPLVPIVDIFAARYAGITQHDMLFDLKKADASVEKVIRDLGTFDGMSVSNAGMGRTMMMFPIPPKLPGIDGFPEDEQFQFQETTIMEPEEYDDLEREGAQSWLIGKMAAMNPSVRGKLHAKMALGLTVYDAVKIGKSGRRWSKQGVESLVGANIVNTPMEFMSLMLRSATEFMMDLYRRPAKVTAASRTFMPFFKQRGKRIMQLTGIRRAFLGGSRTSAAFLSPQLFEKFALPEWREMAEYFVSMGATPVLHLDSEWTPFFEFFRELPRAKCIINLDGTSDIFKAKEVLGDHMCIMGDVPATMLKLGSPDEVHAYCRRLIEEVGEGGGFILSSGCTIPIDAKPENVRAMIESVYG